VPKILIADDDPESLKILGGLLQVYHCNYEIASNGIECIEKAKTYCPDLILLDVMMPKMDGIETCKKLKDDPETATIPVIMLTGSTDRGLRLNGLSVGANDYLPKPVDMAELMIKARNLLQLKNFGDIIGQRGIELEKANARLFQQEKLASLGQLAAGVAHEINNPLAFITSNLGSLQKHMQRLLNFMEIQSKAMEAVSNCAEGKRRAILQQLRKDERFLKIEYVIKDIKKLINESLDGAIRVKWIVQDLRNFCRADDNEFKLADINVELEGAINIVSNELKYKATAKKEYGQIPLTKCNAGRLGQVFMNLLINAAQAIETRGEIIIKSWHAEGSIYVSISDTGCGIPEEISPRIFEPFFTTKEVGKGTGLGLSVAYDILKKHNGNITVESERGKGTTFTVKIPVIDN
jgi:two-component system NtrC family sensor kinase